MNFNTDLGKSYGVAHLLASFSSSLDLILEKQLELPKDRFEFLLSMGSIYVNNKRCLQNVQIQSGTYIRVHQNPRRFPIQNLKWPEQKVFENDDILVINKPPGLPVPSTVDNIRENLAYLISKEIQNDVFVTHRLDMATSGLLILAKTKSAQTQINQQLMNGSIEKTYRALVHGSEVPTGEWLDYMEPSPRAPKKVSRTEQPGWATCRLIVKDQREFKPGLTELTIELITGRTHQIRAQLSSRGFPIVGDLAYGSNLKLAEHEEICLQAFALKFPLPGANMTSSALDSNDSEKLSLSLLETPWQNASFAGK